MVGFLAAGTAQTYAEHLVGFRQGLGETGHIKRKQLTYRWHSYPFSSGRGPKLARTIGRTSFR